MNCKILLCIAAAAATGQTARGQTIFGNAGGEGVAGGISGCGTDHRNFLDRRFDSCVTFPQLEHFADVTTSWDRSSARGVLEARARADIALFPTPCGGGLTSSNNVRVTQTLIADDLTFYVRDNPQQTGTTTASLFLEYQGRVHRSSGTCAQQDVYAQICAGVADNGGSTIPSCAMNGFFLASGGGSGGLTGYSNDETPFPIQINLPLQNLNNPTTLSMFLQVVAIRFQGCPGDLPSGFSEAHARFSLPTSGPVFNLPPGITCRSAELNIVDNQWMGPLCCRPSCCAADLDDGSGSANSDGGVDINDLLFFLEAFEAGTSGVGDLDDGSGTGTPDGGVDINDLLYFLTHFEVGC